MSDNINSSAYEFVTDKLNTGRDVLNQFKAFVEKGTDFLKTLSQFSNALSVVFGLAKAWGIFGEKRNDMDDLYKAIVAALRGISSQIITSSMLNLKLHIDEQSGDADAAFDAVINYLQSIEKHNAAPPDITETMIGHLQKSLEVISTLKKDSYWQRNFDENAVANVTWGKPRYSQPKDSDGLVWDYRLTLPALLKAISIRILLIKTFNTNYQEDYSLEIKKHTDFLYEVYQRIFSGIVLTPAPASYKLDVNFENNYVGHVPPNRDWAHPAYKSYCGAVEIYSGFAYVQSLPLEHPAHVDYIKNYDTYKKLYLDYAAHQPSNISKQEEDIQKAFNRHVAIGIEEGKKYKLSNKRFYLAFAIRAERAWQYVFNDLSGLRELWNTIAELRQLSGGTFLAMLPESLAAISPDKQGFSIKKIITSQVKISTPPFFNEEPLNLDIGFIYYSVREMANILGPELCSPSQPFTSTPFTVSLRSMLAGN